MKLPEIRISMAWLLFYDESQWLKGDYKLEPYEQYEEWTRNYQQAWAKYEAKIVPALVAALGVDFYRSVIDVSLAPFFTPKSDPLIINFLNEPDQFVDVLTHELSHVLLTDNNKLQLNNPDCKIDTVKEWTKLFGKHDFNVLIHIPVHALCKHIWLDVLKQPTRYDREMATLKKRDATDYLKAWEYVDTHDYTQILKDLKQSYGAMK